MGGMGTQAGLGGTFKAKLAGSMSSFQPPRTKAGLTAKNARSTKTMPFFELSVFFAVKNALENWRYRL